MKAIAPALSAHLAARAHIGSRVMVWFQAVLRADGVTPAPWGVWTGEDDRTFTIEGEVRTYLGGGTMAAPADLTFDAGYSVRLHRMGLSHLHPDVRAALAATDIRLRPFDLYQAHLVPGSHDLVADPLLRLRGTVESMSLPRLAQGTNGTAELQLASSAREMARPLEITKSDATLQAVYPGDLFRRYIALSGSVTVAWGEEQG